MTRINVELTREQAGLVIAAIDAEIAKGAGTFLSDNDVLELAHTAALLTGQIALVQASLMSRIEQAVEDYCDACDYSSYKQLTAEDVDYLAQEQGLTRKEFRELLDLESV